jgi:hypothetical protein
MSLIDLNILIIVIKEDVFYHIDFENENIPAFIINDDNSVIESMIIKDLCCKQIDDIKINFGLNIVSRVMNITFIVMTPKMEW